MRGLKDKVAIVTGAASGIGFAIATRLAEEGCHVVIADLNAEGAASKAKELEAHGVQAMAVPCDVTKWEDAQACAKATVDRFGRIDILVNNAGWDVFTWFKDTEPAFWEKVVQINLLGQVRMVRACMDAAFLAQKGGRIINVASDAGRVGSSGEAVYSAAKGGVIAFTKAMARELARSDVTVNCVCPGPTDTPLIRNEVARNEVAAKIMGAMEKAVPMRRMAQPDDIAPAIAFLASDDAGYITGQTLSVNGGLTMQ